MIPLALGRYFGVLQKQLFLVLGVIYSPPELPRGLLQRSMRGLGGGISKYLNESPLCRMRPPGGTRILQNPNLAVLV